MRTDVVKGYYGPMSQHKPTSLYRDGVGGLWPTKIEALCAMLDRIIAVLGESVYSVGINSETD